MLHYIMTILLEYIIIIIMNSRLNPGALQARPVEPLGGFNKGACGTKLLPTTALAYPVGRVWFCQRPPPYTRWQDYSYKTLAILKKTTSAVNLTWLQSSITESTTVA